MTPRLPDFLVIGAMRSGTTSLHEWLAAQPDVWMVPSKEPHFFSKHVEWNKGVDAYKALFDAAAAQQQVGESSTSYTDPKWHELAAERMAATVPGARLLYLARHPIDRLVSDVQHEIRQGREARSAAEALGDPDSPSALRSRYFTCLEPYFARFGAEQLLLVRFEDLVDVEGQGWNQVLAHLGLAPRPAPGTVHNAARGAPDAGPAMRWLRRQPWAPHVRRIPRPLRRAAKRAIGGALRWRRNQSEGPTGTGAGSGVAPEVAQAIWDDVARLERHLGLEHPLWGR